MTNESTNETERIIRRERRIRAQKLIDLYNDFNKHYQRENAGAVMGIIAGAIYRGDFDVEFRSEYHIGRLEGENPFIDVMYLKEEAMA